MSFSLVIRNGKIVDETGNPWFKADVAIRGGRARDNLNRIKYLANDGQLVQYSVFMTHYQSARTCNKLHGVTSSLNQVILKLLW